MTGKDVACFFVSVFLISLVIVIPHYFLSLEAPKIVKLENNYTLIPKQALLIWDIPTEKYLNVYTYASHIPQYNYLEATNASESFFAKLLGLGWLHLGVEEEYAFWKKEILEPSGLEYEIVAEGKSWILLYDSTNMGFNFLLQLFFEIDGCMFSYQVLSDNQEMSYFLDLLAHIDLQVLETQEEEILTKKDAV